MSSIGLLNVGAIHGQSAIIDQASCVIMPVNLRSNVSLVLECQSAGSVRVQRSVIDVLLDVDGSSIVGRLGDPDIVTVDTEGTVSLDIPWMRSVSVHVSFSSCWDHAVGNLVALVVVPEQFDGLITLIHEDYSDWLIPSGRPLGLHRLSVGISTSGLSKLSSVFVEVNWGWVVFSIKCLSQDVVVTVHVCRHWASLLLGDSHSVDSAKGEKGEDTLFHHFLFGFCLFEF